MNQILVPKTKQEFRKWEFAVYNFAVIQSLLEKFGGRPKSYVLSKAILQKF